jgi:hypothetical protein
MKQNYFLLRYFMTVVVLFLFSQSSNAQCNYYNYQVFESFKAAAPSGGSGGNLTQGISAGNFWTTNSLVSISGGYSGVRSMGFNSANASYIITPKIATLAEFTFYYRNTAGTTGGFKVEYSNDYNGSNVAGATWNIVNTTAINSTTYTKFTYDFTSVNNSGGGGVYVKVTDNRGGGSSVCNIDDLGWTSTIAADNNQIVLPKAASSTCTTSPLIANGTYTFYDNGGDSDTYSASQDNTITFMPAVGQQIELTFVQYNSPNGSITLTNTDSPLSNFSSTALPSTIVYLSTAGNGSVTVQYVTTGTTGTGFMITVKSKPPVATCSDVAAVSVTTGSITSGSATVTWTPPGALPSGGYDYYVSTTNTAPNAGITPSGNVANTFSSVTITGQSANTTYYVWVRSNCSGLQGAWVSGGSYTTLCSVYSIPYLEDFNGLNGPLPVCTSTNSPANWATNITNGNMYSTGVGTMFFTKPVALTAGTLYRLTYDYSTILGNADFSVFYGTTNFTPTSGNIATSLVNHVGVSALTTNVVNFTAPSTGIFYIGYRLDVVQNPGSTQFNLDNIRLEVETCLAPSGLSASAITTNSATISWTASTSNPSNGYQYFINTSSTPTPTYSNPTSGTTAAGVTSVVLGGLPSGTTYYMWVRSNCGGLYSSWTQVPVTFTTLVSTAVNVNMSGSVASPAVTNTCDANFFDSQGFSSNYLNNESLVHTFVPTTPGSKLKVVFSSFSTENRYDGLSIYNGNTTGAPLISSGLPVGTNAATCPAGSFYGTNSPGTIYSTAADGSLTFKFTSDVTVVSSGWAATISCVIVPSVTSFTPTTNSCNPGTVITLTGTNFTGITGVTFNNIPATSYTVNSSTSITVTLPSGATTGPIRVSNAQATGVSATSFTVLAPPPVTTDASVCVGGSGSMTTSTTCQGFINSGTAINGSWVAGSPTAVRPTSLSNSTACAFSTTVTSYVGIQFQVNVSGNYTFEMANNTAYDGMGYITSGAFVPGNCSGGGAWVVGDDDSSPSGNEPLMSANLTAGVTYTLYSTTWAATAPNPFTWNITPPSGGQIMLFNNAPMEWYTTASGGTPIGNGSSFNPVGVTGSGLVNTNTPGTYTYYAACGSNNTCRTATNFVIHPLPTVNLSPGSTTICSNTIQAMTVSGSATTYTWSSTIPSVLYTDASATVPYSAGTNASTVYLNTASTTTVTVTGTNTTTGCVNTANSVMTVTAAIAGTASSDQTICPGNIPANISVSGFSPSVSRWEYATDFSFTSGLTAIASSASSVLTSAQMGALSSTRYFRAVVINGACTSYSNVITITVSPVSAGTATSNQSICSGAPADLVLSGNSHPVLKWQYAANAGFSIGVTDIAGSASASLTSAQMGNLNATRYYRAVIVNGGCTVYSNVITVTFNFSEWDGASWSNGVPSATVAAYFSGDYDSVGNLTVCSCSVDGDVAFYAGHSLIVQNEVKVLSGSLTFENNSSLVQVNNATNTGSITYNRNTTPVRKYDYTYWSSPVNPQTLVGLSPFTMSDKYWHFNTAIQNWQNVAGNTLMNPGKGYIVRTPDIAPFNVTTPNVFSGSFYGVPNNGTITTPIAGGSNQLNLIGNPYPSAISADLFINDAANSGIVDGTIYLWTHNTPITTNQYTGSDYAVYNYLGGVGTSAATNPGVNNSIPNGKIASGQSFFIKGLSNGAATFKNSMRLVGQNNQFFRMSNANSVTESDRHRIWLDITNAQGAFKQILVGYVAQAGNGIDRGFDGDLVDAGNTVSLYSLVNANKLSIQGRGLPFVETDEVPLGYTISNAGLYTITLSQYDGLFIAQNVYLEDRLLNIVHNLKASPYIYTTNSGVFDDRFVIRYTDSVSLNTELSVFNDQSVVVYKNNQVLHIKTGHVIMNTVEVFDIRGRLIAVKTKIGDSAVSFDKLPSTQQVLLVKITSDAHGVVTKKVVF